jgi:hypothetical protein
MQLNTKLLYILLAYVPFIIVHIIGITGYIQTHVLYGQFKGFSRLILATWDFGFIHRLYNATPL